MKSLRRIAAVTFAAGLALTAAGCSTSETKTEENASAEPTTAEATEAAAETSSECPVTAGDGSKTVYLVSKGFQHRFWQAVKEGAEKAGEDCNYKVEFVGPENEQQVTQQLNMLQAALDSSPAAIGFAALDSGAAGTLLDQIKAANIPVIAFDSGVESDIPLTTVQTNNKDAAAEAAKHMAELIGKKGKVALICHDQTSETGKQRCTGFQEWMKANAPDITVLDPQYAGEVNAAANVAKAIIQANDDLVGIYGSNEAAATGAIQGANEVQKADLKVVGFDSGKTQINAIKDGSQAGAITQSPVKMGYTTVTAAIQAINGETLDKVIDSGFAWYDKSNIDDPEIAANLYE